MSELIKNIFDIKRSEPYIKYNRFHANNILGLTKVSRWEIMHSNFIAWTLNPSSSHSLKAYPLLQLIKSFEFIKEKLDNDKSRIDISTIHKFYDDKFIVEASVWREEKNIDILIEVKTKEKILPIIIENKVESKENGKKGNQTVEYFKWGEDHYKDRDKYFEPIYIFLFPEYNSKVKQKEERYLRMTYQELVDFVIEPSMNTCECVNSVNNFRIYLQCLSYQEDNEKGDCTMAISSEERKILKSFIDENKNLICAVLNELKDEIDPTIISNIKNSVRDFSDYSFNGEKYRKGRLVLAVVKKYVEENPNVAYKGLKAAFPDNLQGSLGVVISKNDFLAKNKKNKTLNSRYYINTGDSIKLSDGTEVYVCSQWGGSTNFPNFLKHATTSLKYTITKI